MLAPLAAAAAARQSVVIVSHGRSGSTLLLDMLAQDPLIWTSYEPLQEVRQLPSWLPPSKAGRCRDVRRSGGNALESRCPLRDASLLLSALGCDTAPLLATWYQELELAGRAGQYVPHTDESTLRPSWGSGWVPISDVAGLADHRARLYRDDAAQCAARPTRVAKSIRLNGHLEYHLRDPLR